MTASAAFWSSAPKKATTTTSEKSKQSAKQPAIPPRRLTLPKELKLYAGIDTRENVPKEERGKAVFIGLGDHAEIWEESRLEAYQKRRKEERQTQRKIADAAHAAKMKANTEENQ